MATQGKDKTTDRTWQISGHDPPTQATSSNSQGDPAGNTTPPNEDGVNWGRVGAVTGGALITGAVAVAAAPVVLGVAGFTTGGVAAGSVAAAAQSAIYGGFTGGFFSLLQSAGAAGIGLAGNAAIAATGATVGGAGSYFFVNRNSRGETQAETIKLLICGGGSGAHAFGGIASSRKGTEVRVLTLNQDEAKRCSSVMQTKSLLFKWHREGLEPTSIKSKPALITTNPDEAIRDIDFVVFPEFAHEHYLDDYLNALKPHIRPGMTLIGLPGGPDFNFHVCSALGETVQQCTILNFEWSPWICSTAESGVECDVLDTKETLLGTIKVSFSTYH
ncbi:tauropine dehydrogenase-like [Stylophora pistillata]|uniref:tauropine dehydrogenase-like n=1 Tax=Stylophora pistillata TaxID=50429 RepID=UPI000C03F55C|nr:tauropine dehydrogenase-like [Stylophora pistillata]